jgi:RNA polymerase sigma factor (sigma-70 family)
MTQQHQTDCKQFLDAHRVVQLIREGADTKKAALYQCMLKLFEDLFSKLSKDCYITKGSLKEEWAKEAMNTTLHNFIRHVEKRKFDPGGSASLSHYLYVLYYRSYLKIWRKESRHEGVSLEIVPVNHIPVVALSVTDIPGRTRAQIETAIARCHEGCKAVLTMTYLEGYHTTEIAELLGLSHQRIKNQLVTCSRQLRNNI